MIDWHSFLQVKRLPLRSLRGPPTSPALSAAMTPVLQSGSSFTRERMDKVAPKRGGERKERRRKEKKTEGKMRKKGEERREKKMRKKKKDEEEEER